MYSDQIGVIIKIYGLNLEQRCATPICVSLFVLIFRVMDTNKIGDSIMESIEKLNSFLDAHKVLYRIIVIVPWMMVILCWIFMIHNWLTH